MKRFLTVCCTIAVALQFACNNISLEPKSDPIRVDGSKATMEDISFKSNQVTMSGAIILPPEKDIVAAAVFVHGPGKEGRDIQLAKKFAKEGIAILVYDKRGSGLSGGNYVEDNSEQKMKVLAEDAVAAVDLLSQNEKIKGKPIGLVGFSEAGWVIPLAAAQSKDVKFIGLWSGPVAKLSEELLYSYFTSDRDFKDVPGFRQAVSIETQLNLLGVERGRDMDPTEILRLLKVPGFWIYGKNDGNIPVDISVERLDKLKLGGAKYDYAVFTGKGHELLNETFTSMTGWIKTINDPAAMTAWVKQVKDSAAIDNTAPLNSDGLGKFAGTYTRSDAPLLITVKEKDKKLVIVINGKLRELTQSDDDSFYFKNEDGYAFLDFELDNERLRVEQLHSVLSLDKQK